MKSAASSARRYRRSGGEVVSPQAARRRRSATTAIKRDITLLESSRTARRVEFRMAPPRYAERRHARPGAGIKCSRASMAPRPR